MDAQQPIALLTLHRTANFGSALQAYALYTAVAQAGHAVHLLDYTCAAVRRREALVPWPPSPRALYRRLRYGKALRQKRRALDRFLTGYAALSPAYTRRTLAQANLRYQTFLIGSDLVWGQAITGGDPAYFLDFTAPGARRLAFAASAGNPWDAGFARHIQPLLARFTHIAVREAALSQWVGDLLGDPPPVVGDPTLLLPPAHWQAMAAPPMDAAPYVLVYFCDPAGRIFADAAAYARAHGCAVRYVTFGRAQPGTDTVQPKDPGTFLGLVRHARCVFTASYHGMLFALYFRREFFYYNRANVTRMQALATWLGVTDRDALHADIRQAAPLCHDALAGKLDALRQRSLAELAAMLTPAQEVALHG
ncbi:MAG: polysaccharide pyruvyl transferase family protein [Candidatus Limiplasma sp.]|nr:polysaccharide pyruvyl transferase family protein [Candidatus Limiplasma sp.]